MEYEYLELSVEDGLATVVMDRPPGNALSPGFIDELDSMVSEMSADESIGCVVFKSALPRHFMVGADLKALTEGVDTRDMDPQAPPRDRLAAILPQIAGRISELLAGGQSLLNRIERMPKPTIAAIGGNALGGGLEFCLACDFRLMARGEPTIGLTEVGLGLIPGAGGTQRLPRVVGRALALEMIFLSRRLDADDAESVGLVNRAVNPGALDRAVTELGGTLASGATLAMTCARTALLEGEEKGLGAGLAMERECIARLVGTDELAEGLLAFSRLE